MSDDPSNGDRLAFKGQDLGPKYDATKDCVESGTISIKEIDGQRFVITVDDGYGRKIAGFEAPFPVASGDTITIGGAKLIFD